MNVFRFLRILLARWRMIAILSVIGLALGTLAAFSIHRPFKATAQVLVDVREPDTVGQAGMISEQLSPDYLATQGDVIKSDRVVRSAVQALGMTVDPDAIAKYQEAHSQLPIVQYYANQLKSGINITTTPQSRVVSIEFSSLNPTAAATMANAIARAYRDVSLDLQVEPARQSATWYDRTAIELQRKLQTAQAKLAAKQQELGITADQDQTDAEVSRLAALNTQLAGLQAQKAAAGAQTGGGALPSAMANPVVAGLQSDIARLEAQRRQLATVAGPNNVDYIQLNNQIGELRSKLAEQQSLVSRSASASSAAASVAERDLTNAVAAQRVRVIQSRAARGDIAALQQDVDNLKTTYEQFAAKRSQIGLLGTGAQTNVSILSDAMPPTRESGPPRLVVAAGGLIFFAVIGMILAFILEFFDQRIRSGDDSELWLGIPNLGGIRTLAAPEPLLLSYTPGRFLPGQSAESE